MYQRTDHSQNARKYAHQTAQGSSKAPQRIFAISATNSKITAEKQGETAPGTPSSASSSSDATTKSISLGSNFCSF